MLRKIRGIRRGRNCPPKQIVLGDKTLKWLEKSFGDAPRANTASGSRCTAAARRPRRKTTATGGLFWALRISARRHQRCPARTRERLGHVACAVGGRLFDRLIADIVLQRDVDPKQIYLIGYSAGGDGVYQFAPRLADHFAAAAMCAGHPNHTTPGAAQSAVLSSTWAGTTRPTIAMWSCANSAPRWTCCKRPIQRVISIASRFFPACRTTCRGAKPK